MTHPIERASVEQADRDFAAFWILISLQNAKLVREGKWDHHEGVQAIARHRQQARDAGFAEGVRRAAEACEAQAVVFASTEYATGQPLSSVSERIACALCAAAIREALSAEANEGRCDG